MAPPCLRVKPFSFAYEVPVHSRRCEETPFTAPPRLAYEVPGGGRTVRSMNEQDGCAALQRCVLSEAPSEVATPGSEQSMYCEEVPSW